MTFPPFRSAWLSVALAASGVGCAHYQPKPANLDRSGAAVEARSLADESLKRFLAENLHRDLSAAPAAWDFEALCWVAFYYNPSLEVARAQFAAARAGVTTASARPNPTLTFTPGFNSNAASGVSPWLPSVNFDFLLETSNKRARRTELARFAAESARQGIFSAAWQVRGEVWRALVDLNLAARRGEKLRAQAEVQRRIVALTEERFGAGAASSRELAFVQVALVRTESAAVDAAAQEPLARQRLAQALGLPVAALSGAEFAEPAAVALDVVQIAEAQRQSLRSRSDVLAALARFDASEAALETEAAKQNSDLHLGPGYQWDQGANKWTLALAFELPLFHRNEGPLAEAEARRREAAAVFNATQAQVLTEIEAAVAAQRSAAARVAALRRLQGELARQAAQTRGRFDQGAADQLELQNALLAPASDEVALLEAESALAAAAGQLEAALQVPFPNLAALASNSRLQP